ncbi:MAG TPA: pyrroloquinoline quinone-dependent dehydrogenase [Gammaproteobacteria bacterium]|jgi:quinoprotein glucose dehydrogenase|nr:pyrroloquinoline quinone-dependent dehydrogenase [Gammaproteobacteria bacterium]HIF85377.1 pyrroloquinoline quinone-dependent dehydrogenase [Gammaproteobacteria bacterium]HIL62583.1 pyrroloquinoline quinone-dependent dehydrogenase [Porticoccaceae bacterium]
MAANRLIISRGALLAVAVIFLVVAGRQIAAQTEGDWPMYRGNHAGTGYSSLSQISVDNVSELVESWRYSLAGDGGDRQPNSQATPIVIGGVMYLPAADRIVALNPVSGEEIWRHIVADGAPSRRGVAYWAGGEGIAPRIIFTAGRRLLALDAETGRLATGFGPSGEIDMVIPYNSVPMVYGNIVIVGANTPRGASGGIGNARAFDARNGDKIWEFSSIPQPGSLGHDSWAGDSWVARLGANAWPFYFTVDTQRGLLYLPLASPIPFAYGGDRGGANLFANSLVAVDIHSGEYKWHFQTIHHDLWDHDPPAPPALFDIASGGSTVPALGVTTKSGYLYILNRVTGEPIFGVEERAMPSSDVPGEETFPTQPIPLRPPALARVSYDPADLVSATDTSAEHAEACAELLAGIGEIYNVGAFTPWAYRPDSSAGKTTLLFPGLTGGPNWGGAAFDPNSGYIFVFSQDLGTFGWMEDAENGSEFPYVRRGLRPGNFDVRIGDLRLPCQKPPWGKLTAIDSVSGDVVWQQAVGLSENLPPGRQHTGRPGRAAALVTAGEVLFIAATDDNRLRALATATGEELWVVKLPRRGNANPMTYMGADNKQYLLVSATDSVVAYHLR